MLKIIRLILQVTVIAVAGYSLMTQDLVLTSLVLLLLGMFLLVAGFERIEKNRQEFWGYALVVIALFIFAVSWQDFFLGA